MVLPFSHEINRAASNLAQYYEAWLSAGRALKALPYGMSWKQVGKDLPYEPINVVKEDPKSDSIIYVGTDGGVYVSFDQGNTFMMWNGGLPKSVPVHDIAIQQRDNEIVLGTHGRSVFIADVKPLQSLKSADKSVMVFSVDNIRFSEEWGEKESAWEKPYLPAANVLYYVGKQTNEIGIEIYDEKKALVRKLTAKGSAGFHTFKWDVKVSGPIATSTSKKSKSTKPVATTPLKYAQKGKYTIKFINGADSSETTVEIK